jgi:hypothetical protein
MAREWDKPYEKLLGYLESHYKGRIARPNVQNLGSASPSAVPYPKFLGKIRGKTFMVEIRSFAELRPSRFGLGGAARYLRIRVDRPTAFRMNITHEDLLSRVARKLKLSGEFQTGSPKFDEAYYLRPTTGKGRELLKKKPIQKAIKGLGSFSLLEVHKGGVLWANLITEPKQLASRTVDSTLKKILDFAKLVPTTKKK